MTEEEKPLTPDAVVLGYVSDPEVRSFKCGAYLEIPHKKLDGTDSETICSIIFCCENDGHDGPHNSRYAPKEEGLKWKAWK